MKSVVRALTCSETPRGCHPHLAPVLRRRAAYNLLSTLLDLRTGYLLGHSVDPGWPGGADDTSGLRLSDPAQVSEQAVAKDLNMLELRDRVRRYVRRTSLDAGAAALEHQWTSDTTAQLGGSLLRQLEDVPLGGRVTDTDEKWTAAI